MRTITCRIPQRSVLTSYIINNKCTKHEAIIIVKLLTFY